MAATGTPTPNIGLRIPLGTDPASVDDINYNSNLIDTKLGAVGDDSVQDQIDDLNSKLTSQYGEIVTGIQYEYCANVVTVYLNGKTVTNASSWTKLADLPSGLATRYSAHYKALSGHDIQIAGQTINYRGSAGDVFGACTYVRG